MSRKTWLAAVAGAGVLVAGSLTAQNAFASSAPAAAVASSVGSYTAAGDLVASRNVVRGAHVHGRGNDGHGGEHSGGAAYHASKKRSAPAKPAKASKKRGGHGGSNSNSGNNGGAGHHHPGGGCHYPPSSSPQVTLSGPNHTHAGRTVTLTGKVSLNGCAMSQVKLGLYSSHDGAVNWVMIRDGQLDKDGNFSFTVPSYATHYYQAVAAAGDGYTPASSNILPLVLKTR